MHHASRLLVVSLCLFAGAASCTSTSDSPPTGTGGSGKTGGSGGTAQGAGTGGGSSPSGGSGGNLVAGTGGSAHTGGTAGAAANGSGGVVGSSGGQSATGGTTGSGGAVGGTGGGNTNMGGGGRSSSGGNTPDGGVTASGGRSGDAGATDANQSTLPTLTLFLAGDSTVANYTAAEAPQEGWGQEVGQFFISKVTVNNQAIGGASVKTFQSGSRWSNITSNVKAGDYVMIQFGANDSGNVEGRHVEVPDFKIALGEMIDAIKAKNATPILVTPSAFREFTGNKAGNTRLGPYANAMLELGPTKGVLVDDLNARGVELLNMIGPSGAASLYLGDDKAHFVKAGAVQMATFVVEELTRIGSPLAAYRK